MTVIIYLLLCLIWGSTWLTIKFGLTALPPLLSSGARFLMASVVVGLILVVRKSSWGGSWIERGRIAAPGIPMYAISYSLVYIGEQYIDSALAAILFGSYPFLVALFGRVLTHDQPLSRRQWLGMLCGFGGLVVITLHAIGSSRAIITGTICLLISSAASAYGTVVHRRDNSEVPIETAAFWQFSIGAVIMLLAAALTETWEPGVWSTAAIGTVLYLALFGTVVGFLGFYWLLKRASTVAVSTIAFMTPLVASVFGTTIGNEQLGLQVILGGVLTLLGVALVVMPSRPLRSA